jgi:hypothetical protein
VWSANSTTPKRSLTTEQLPVLLSFYHHFDRMAHESADAVSIKFRTLY